MGMAEALLLTALEAAGLTGYVTEKRFRAAVDRGVMPKPPDPKARPQMWSRERIVAFLRGDAGEKISTDPIMDHINGLQA